MPEEPSVSQEAQGSYIAQAASGGTASIQVYTSPPSLQSQNRARFLVRLHTRYQDLLEQSLQGAVRLTLELAGQPQAVAPPVHLIYASDQQPHRSLPTGTSLRQVYEQAGHELLVLGAPGAGKSTLLLELAFDLVKQAEQDQSQLLPVIVPLSSWANKQPPFEQWLAEQIALLYAIDPLLAARWVREECFLPLLDGFDEMEEQARAACIAALNSYHHRHLHPLVVSSRQAEYETATEHALLVLHGAVMVQPLTREQVNIYLEQAGEPVAGLRKALHEKAELQELATTPLMLSILILTYQGKAVQEVSATDTLSEQQRQIFATYVERMLAHKAQTLRGPQYNVVSSLIWLARQMRTHNQTIFYLEHLQPDWLHPLDRRRYRWSAVLLPGTVIGMIASILVHLLFPAVLDNDVLYSLPQYAILGGLIGGLMNRPMSEGRRSPRRANDSSHQNSRYSFRSGLVLSLLIGLLVELSFGMNLYAYHSLQNWLFDGGIYGIGLGLSSFLLIRWFPVRTTASVTLPPASARRGRRFISWLRTVHTQRALRTAACLGLGFGLSISLNYGLVDGLNYYWLVDGLSDGLIYGLHFGLIALLLSLMLEEQGENIALTEHLQWTWRSLMRSLFLPKHVRMALFVASIITIGVGLSVVLGRGSGLTLWLNYGLVDGLSVGLSVGLAYWLLPGLFQGIVREQIKDHARQVPNQGIRHSFRHGVVMGIISAGVIGIVGTLILELSVWLSIWLSIWLSTWLNLGPGTWLANGLNLGPGIWLNLGPGTWLNYGWLIVGSGFLVGAISGGLAILRHYIIRWLLALSHQFPWSAPRFLEEATTHILLRRVGGGYSFPHRLLLDYFADLPDKTP